jgi:hypothetical protein
MLERAHKKTAAVSETAAAGEMIAFLLIWF